MKIHSTMTVNGRVYESGQNVPGSFIYPFFMIHMLAFGLSGFFLAYGMDDAFFLYMHGGIAILVYLVFYLAIFGRDEVEWMFINAGLGIFGILSQMSFILSLFGRGVGDYPWYIHVVPVMYFIMYTFLIRHAVLDLFGARDDEAKKRRVQWGYVTFWLALYGGLHFLGV